MTICYGIPNRYIEDCPAYMNMVKKIWRIKRADTFKSESLWK